MFIDAVLLMLFLGCGTCYAVMNGPILKKYCTSKEKNLGLTTTLIFLTGFVLSLTFLVGEPTLTVTNLERNHTNQYVIKGISLEADKNIAIVREKKNYPYTLLRDKTIYKVIYLGKVTREWNNESKT